MFAVPFDEIATVIGCSTATARQHASRARRRVQGADPATGAGDTVRRQQIVDAFLAAARGGDFDALLSLLAPDAVMRADAVAVAAGAAGEVVGAAAVAEVFAGRARGARPALVDGAAGVVWATGGRIRAVFDFTIVDGRVAGIDLVMDPASIDQLDVVVGRRPGVSLDPELRPVGRVESPLVDPAAAPRQGDEGAPEAWLVFDAAVADAMRDLAVGDQVVVLTWLDRARARRADHPPARRRHRP